MLNRFFVPGACHSGSQFGMLFSLHTPAPICLAHICSYFRALLSFLLLGKASSITPMLLLRVEMTDFLAERLLNP